MHFHVPKPLHGWREFVGEVGIIVLGVLIALAAEQIVQRVNDQHELSQARQAMRSELAHDVANLRAMAAQDACADARLSLLESWANGKAAINSAHLASFANRPLLYSLSTTAWEVTKASAVAGRMPLQERLKFAQVYDLMENEKAHVLDERHAWDLLARYAGEQALSAQDARALRADIGSVRIQDDARRSNGANLVAHVADLGVKPDSFIRSRDPRQLCAAPS